MSKIRVLIADDSASMRQKLADLLQRDGRFELAGVARDGQEAVEKAVALQPDVITMDIQMPRMDGITSLQYIMEVAPCPVIILSSFSKKGAMVTFEAMELGAFDFMPKPDRLGDTQLLEIFTELTERIVAAAHSRKYRKLKEAVKSGGKRQNAAVHGADYSHVVVIGVSTGGPKTVMDILPWLPADFPAPVLLVQHMPPLFTASFAERLNKSVPMKVVEAEHRCTLEPGTIYIAPGGQNLFVERMLGTTTLRLAVRSEPDAMLYKPSVDVTMLSLLKQVPARRIIGVLLTGIGSDGAEGMTAIRQGGGLTIAEAEETAVVYGMPKAALDRGGARLVLPSYLIGQTLVREVQGHGSQTASLLLSDREPQADS